jgi:hypothetical protein
MLTMLLGGLWHGAGWNWVVWGGLQGVLLAGERLFKVAEPPGRRLGILRWVITLHLVCVSWILFRSHDLTQSMVMLEGIVTMQPGESLGSGLLPFYYLAMLVLVEALGLRSRWLALGADRPWLVRFTAYFACVVLVYTFAGASNREFIYFQF